MKRLFSPEALNAQGQQFVGEILFAAPWDALRGSLIATAVALVAICAALFIPVSTTMMVPGSLVSQHGSYRLTSGRPGTVTRQLVALGDQVKIGQPVLVISMDMATTSAGQSVGAISEAIARRLTLLQEEQATQSTLEELQISRLKGRRLAAEAKARALERQIVDSQARADLRQSAVDRYKALEEYFPKGQIELQVESLLQQKEAVKELNRQLGEVLAEGRDIGSELTLRPFIAKQQTAARLREIATLQGELASAEIRREITLTAPVSGKVSALPGGVGQAVAADSVVMTIVPTDSKLLAEFQIPDRAVPLAREGVQMHLRFQAFPYQKFGEMSATVTTVSTEAAPSLQSSQSSEMRQFIGRAKLSRQELSTETESATLLAGMQFNGFLKSDERRVWQWIVEPLLR
jgi:membrane fusion protein